MASKVSDQTIDEIVRYVNERVDIPYIPEHIEALLFKAIISLMLSFGDDSGK